MTDITLNARTALFTPANRTDRVEKALASRADVVIADLEDAVAESDKDSTRQTLQDFLSEVETELRERLVVRINAPSTETGQQDLAMLSESQQPSAIMVPKIEATGTLDQLPKALHSTTILALVETPTGVRDIHQIAALGQVDRLAIGAVDLAAALGCQEDAVPIQSARAAVVLASAAARLSAPLDTPSTDFTDTNVMRTSAERSVRDGFGGTLCIHPHQIEHVVNAFTPSYETVCWAERVLAAGDGAGTVDGQMVDRPVILRAERILHDARRSSR